MGDTRRLAGSNLGLTAPDEPAGPRLRKVTAKPAGNGPPAGPAEAVVTPEERRARLVDVYREASRCTRCPLSETRKTVVFGAGSSDADLMFIGEGPGAEEDRQGLPFVGRAGA